MEVGGERSNSATVAAVPAPSTFALVGLVVFFLLVLLLLGRRAPTIFWQRRGLSHRAAGASHLTWLIVGVALAIASSSGAPITRRDEDREGEGLTNAFYAYSCLAYDAVLGVLGVFATLTAAVDFPHRRVRNNPGQSGTLARSATVTQSEMIEHAFYQILNLCQSLYLHGITWWWKPSLWPPHRAPQQPPATLWKFLALMGVTSPWLVRRSFPVHSFSANWATVPRAGSDQASSTIESESRAISRSSDTMVLERNLYQVKKWQYVFYKHVVLHGVNISVAFPGSVTIEAARDSLLPPTAPLPLPLSPSWRVFWVCLNASYVMEFFLQSLVKAKRVGTCCGRGVDGDGKAVLSQDEMLVLQRLLMAASTLAALPVLLGGIVRPGVALLSLLLNFANRGHDVVNTLLVGIAVAVVD